MNEWDLREKMIAAMGRAVVLNPSVSGYARAALDVVQPVMDAKDEEIALLRALATEILGRFNQYGHPGRPCQRTGWIPEQQVAAWHAAIDESAQQGEPT